MKRITTKNKKNKPIADNAKIWSYFPKLPKNVVDNINTEPLQNNLKSEKNYKPVIDHPVIKYRIDNKITDITNLPIESISPDTLTPNQKRQCDSENTPSPDIIPSSDIKIMKNGLYEKTNFSPPRKKSKNYNKPCNDTILINKASSSKDCVSDLVLTEWKQEIKLVVTTPPKKNYQKALHENIKITPSKICRSKTSSSSESGEKLQASILNYLSPSPSKRSTEKQKENEITPTKSSRRKTSPLIKVKTKLDFNTTDDESLNIVENNLMKKIEIESISPNNTKISNEGINDVFEDSWEFDTIIDNAEYSLDLANNQYCKVISIENFPDKVILALESTKCKQKALCVLQGFWTQIKLKIGSLLCISAVYDNINAQWKVDNTDGLLVYEPDNLLSTTSVVGGIFCKRQSIFKERFTGFDSSNRMIIIGVLVHTLLEQVLTQNVTSSYGIERIIKKITSTYNTIRMLYASSLTINDIEKELMDFIPRIITFMKEYVGTSTAVQKNEANWNGRIDSIQDIEENIWCPALGLKGKVDVTVKVKNTVMPLELKTGRPTLSLEHRGQVVLYTMMMNKFGYNVTSGLLLYLREGLIKEVPITDNERRDLIILRNHLSYYLNSVSIEIDGKIMDSATNHKNSSNVILLPPELPEPIDHHGACTKCSYNIICAAYSRDENLEIGNKNFKTMQDEVLKHLTISHIRYFVHWSALLILEDSSTHNIKSMKQIYTSSPIEREKDGRCIMNLQIDKVVPKAGGLFIHTFKKSNNSNSKITNLLSCGIGEFNYVVISTDNRPAIISGFVHAITHDTVSITLEKELDRCYAKTKFHIDSYDSNNSHSFNMASLTLLMEKSESAERLRNFIIDKRLPTLKDKLPGRISVEGAEILSKLNKMQQRAVLKAIAATDYLLIKGMPGTGKTATLVALVQLLIKLNQTVLITSHTHTAIDNICLRLQKCGVDLLRLGSDAKIHVDLKNKSEYVLTQNCKSLEELEEIYSNAKVVAVTCLGSNHPILNKHIFDVCIVDESTQVLQCSAFRPLYASRKFILVGDPDQLPPIVKDQRAISHGLSESLFERLDNSKSTVTLNLNYRMNSTITAVANALTYEGQLLTANEDVANLTLNLPNLKDFQSTYKDQLWIIQALDTSLKSSVQIINTGPVWNQASYEKLPLLNYNKDDDTAMCTNIHEISVIATLIMALLKGGVLTNTIGVIAPYRAQVAQLLDTLKNFAVEVSTVDQFQGRDKDIIIYSCTKSCDSSQFKVSSKYAILEDKRRLTVAITRAKMKFILVGDLSTVDKYTPFARLLENLDRNFFLNLQDGQLGFHWNEVTNLKTCNL